MKYAFVNGIILDGKKDMKPVTGRAVLTDGNRIVDIVSDLAALRGYEIIDLKGAYLLPGLIDLHVHLALSGKPPKPKKDNKATDYEKLYKILTGNALIRAAARQLVASYCKTNNLNGYREAVQANIQRMMEDDNVCSYCGAELKQPKTGRKKHFCNDVCRRKWWNQNRDKINVSPDAIYREAV